jgi:hypothetical protein
MEQEHHFEGWWGRADFGFNAAWPTRPQLSPEDIKKFEEAMKAKGVAYCPQFADKERGSRRCNLTSWPNNAGRFVIERPTFYLSSHK